MKSDKSLRESAKTGVKMKRPKLGTTSKIEEDDKSKKKSKPKSSSKSKLIMPNNYPSVTHIHTFCVSYRAFTRGLTAGLVPEIRKVRSVRRYCGRPENEER